MYYTHSLSRSVYIQHSLLYHLCSPVYLEELGWREGYWNLAFEVLKDTLL